MSFSCSVRIALLHVFPKIYMNMAPHYEVYKTLIVATVLTGIYFRSIEKIYGPKWYIKSLKLLFIFPGISMPVFFVFSIKYQFFDKDELGNKIYGLTILLYIFFTTFTAFSFQYYRNDFLKVFELWDCMFQEDLFPEDRQKLLVKNRRVTNAWLKIFGSITVMSCLGYFSFMYTNPEKKLTHPTGVPYRYQSPDYELVNTLDLIVCSFGFAALVTCDSMTMALISLEEAQIHHLKLCLAQILDNVSVTDSGKIKIKISEASVLVEPLSARDMNKTFEETDKNIRIWLSHHQKILRFHDELQKILSVILSVKFLVFVLIICLLCFLGIVGKLKILEILLSMVFCANTYVLYYVNVTFSDSIIEKSRTIFEEAFGKSWFLYPKKLKSAFHIILLRSNKPVNFTTFRIYPLCSSSFLRILTSAYSFFTFMLQINNKKRIPLDRTLDNL